MHFVTNRLLTTWDARVSDSFFNALNFWPIFLTVSDWVKIWPVGAKHWYKHGRVLAGMHLGANRFL